MKTPLIIGHRGASAVAPENTMAAFREAIAAGCDGIEFDVRLTRDGIPVIIHDNTLRRTAGLSGRVADLTWAEIKQINVGGWFTRGGESFKNETVPSLEELLTLCETNDLIIVLEMQAAKDGIDAVGYFAQVPHYVSGPYPAAALELLHAVERHLGIELEPVTRIFPTA